MKTILTLIVLALCSSAFAEGIIPDLTARQVKNAFKELGLPEADTRYTAEQAEHDTRGEVEGNLFALRMYGPPYDSTGVNVITAMVQNNVLEDGKTNELSLSFLCLAASMPYTGCTPAEARIWIAANIGKNTEKMFGPVKLQLFSQARSRILRMSTEPLIPKVAEGTAPAVKHMDMERRAKNDKMPSVGEVFGDVEKEHGKPIIRDADTGWATWPKFKVLFKDGKAAEVTVR
jgi:hypothetical protein